MKHFTTSVEVGGKTITFETGELAKQASGAVIVSSGDSKLLVTTVCTEGFRAFDFLPLTVDYQDRNGANGTIPGGFLKREGRSSGRHVPLYKKTFSFRKRSSPPFASCSQSSTWSSFRRARSSSSTKATRASQSPQHHY